MRLIIGENVKADFSLVRFMIGNLKIKIVAGAWSLRLLRSVTSASICKMEQFFLSQWSPHEYRCECISAGTLMMCVCCSCPLLQNSVDRIKKGILIVPTVIVGGGDHWQSCHWKQMPAAKNCRIMPHTLSFFFNQLWEKEPVVWLALQKISWRIHGETDF